LAKGGIILSDPNNPPRARNEVLVMEEPRKGGDAALKPMADEEESFMVRYQNQTEPVFRKARHQSVLMNRSSSRSWATLKPL
jgi:hypothetical protein